MPGNKLKRNQKKLLVVFTDGSCSKNGSRGAMGGIGVHFPDGELADISKIYSRSPCTNQKTELYAILTALRYINQNLGLDNYHVLIKTDSNYCINCVTTWIAGWIRNGWINSKGEPVANKEFIEPIYRYTEAFDIEFEHVSAHTNSDDPDSLGNEMADTLATRATQKAIAQARSQKPVQKQSSNSRSGSKTPATRNNYGNRSKPSNQSHQNYQSYQNYQRRPYTRNNRDHIEVELVEN